jgi:deoxyribodipyrimidine photolyase-related protein
MMTIIGSCFTKEVKTGDKACPFNSLYWNFYDKNEDKLGRIHEWNDVQCLAKMKPEAQTAL